MPVELAEIAAGLPMAASFAMATGISAVREVRRRSALNEAMHELRRPLQVLALSLPAGSSGGEEASGSALRMAVDAIDRLDREINGRPGGEVSDTLSLRRAIEAAVARWRPRATVEGRSLELFWRVGEPVLIGGDIELVQALDNMISNGFEHGSGAVEIEVSETSSGLRIAVLDGGVEQSARRSCSERDRRARRRHGHGLRIVRRAAAQHGGSFCLRTAPGGSEARLELSLTKEAR